MSDRMRNDMASAWKNQPIGHAETSLDQLRRRAQKLEKRVLSRNLREYGAAALVVAAFGYYISVFHSLLVRAGCGLLIAGTLYVVYALYRRGSARALAAETAIRPCIEFYREELQRQRDLLRGVWRWYLLPLVPGLAVFLFGLFWWAMQQPNAPAHSGKIATAFILTAAACALVFVGVGKLNQAAARKIQREIDILNTLQKES